MTSTRMAAIDIDGQLLLCVLGIFAKAGVEVVGSLQSGMTGIHPYPIVRLVIRSDMLPGECDGRKTLVTAIMSTQRINGFDVRALESFQVARDLEPGAMLPTDGRAA